MYFLSVLDLILYVFIISQSYYFICKRQIKTKELCFFGVYTLLVGTVLELPFYLLYLDELGIGTFLFPLVLYSYFRWIKQYEKDRGLFLSLLLSLLYEGTHTFLSVTFFLYNRRQFCFTILWSILFRCSGVDLCRYRNNHSLFPLGTNLFWQRLPLSFLDKSIFCITTATYCIFRFRYSKYD